MSRPATTWGSCIAVSAVRTRPAELWQEAAGAAAADSMLSQALAALGMPEGAVYAVRPEAVPAGAQGNPSPNAESGGRLPFACPSTGPG